MTSILGTGDDTRTWGPPFQNNESVYFMSINRNKKVLPFIFVTMLYKSLQGNLFNTLTAIINEGPVKSYFLMKVIEPKHQSYFYYMVLEFLLCYSYLSDSTSHTSIFAQFLFVRCYFANIFDCKEYVLIIRFKTGW